MRRAAIRLLLTTALVAAAIPARAHEVHHEVAWGKAVSVRAACADGRSLADLPAEVFSPKDSANPYWKGTTDRNGWLSFVPDGPGAWRVRVVDPTGHGFSTFVKVPDASHAQDRDSGAPTALALAARPVVGVALVVAIFAALFLVRRALPR